MLRPNYRQRFENRGNIVRNGVIAGRPEFVEVQTRGLCPNIRDLPWDPDRFAPGMTTALRRNI